MAVAIEERLAVLEAQHRAQEVAMTKVDTTIRQTELDLRETVRALDERMERRFDAVDRRFDTMDRRFQWLIAIQVTTLLTALGAAFGLGR